MHSTPPLPTQNYYQKSSSFLNKTEDSNPPGNYMEYTIYTYLVDNTVNQMVRIIQQCIIWLTFQISG